MTRRVIVRGGYGGFGARISLRLAAMGFDVMVAGRSERKAAAFCAGRAGLRPILLGPDLAEHAPWAIVDTAGPFQSSGYDVARAAIAAGCHYLDIADARDFVTGIDRLDAAAKTAGVAVVSGVSSVPALSGAVARHLSGGLRVRAVEIAISASNRAAAGPSVVAAILSYVGRPLRIWRGRRWQTAWGWQDLHRQGFILAGGTAIAPRLTALCDVPDLTLLPARLPGRPSVMFRAGTELMVANRALAALAWAVRRSWIVSPARLAPFFVWLQRRARRLGSDRSGMILRMFGVDQAGSRVERRWTLIAERGDGPEIPALAVPALLARLGEGAIEPGARDGGELLSLADFEPAFAGLAIRHETIELPLPAALYPRVMGSDFDRLATAVRAMHRVLRDGGASGRATVEGATGPVARLIARIVGFPSPGDHALHVDFAEADGVETWTRDFSGQRFRSRLSMSRGMLIERFGPLRFGFDLVTIAGGLEMHLRRWWIGPLPLPRLFAPRSLAREWEADGRFHFDVPIALPLIGRIVHYRGWLEPVTGPD